MSDSLVAAPTLPLQSGDHLTRREFERRYSAHPEIKKAELIEGRVYVSSPLRFAAHGQPHIAVAAWLGTYAAFTPRVSAADNATVRLDAINEPQPDAQLRLDPAAGGHSRLDEDDYVEGAPELVIEIAASSASYDLHDKLHAYRRNGVDEYLVWRVHERQFDWFVLVGDDYVPLAPDGWGILRSRIFPGLCLDVGALLAGDLARVLATLQRGLESPEHAAFVARVQGPSNQG